MTKKRDPRSSQGRRSVDSTAGDRARAIIESARDAIISMSSDGVILDFNRAAEQMFGYRSEEVIGANVATLMPSPDRERHAEYVARYERTGEAHAIGKIRDVLALRSDGEVFPAELAISEIRVAGARIYTAIVRDVSMDREAAKALRRARDFSERLIETTPFIVLVLDRGGRIVRFNRRMMEVTGYSLAEVLNQNWFERFVPEREEDRIRVVFDRALEGQSMRGNVNRILTKAGEERIIRWYAEPLRDADGNIESVLCGGEDITEQVRASKEVQRLARVSRERERLADLGALAARIVHDLGNPISGLSMQAQLLIRRVHKQPGTTADTLLQPAERILAAVDRLNTLIRGFMDFAREQKLELEDVDLRDLVESVLDLWASVSAEHGIELELACDSNIRIVRADPAKLRRVLENLVNNAIEAVGEGPGHVCVTISEPSPRHVRISVADDGPGVAPDIDVFRLFETTKPQGTGIGLAVARQMVIAHGGGIDFANVKPRGAIFNIDLPVDGTTAEGGGTGS